MSDHHNAQERCKACAGEGRLPVVGKEGHLEAIRAGREIKGEVREGVCSYYVDCEKCGGLGRRTYKRMTYRHQLGRPLHPNNSGQLQWGPKYRAFHEKAWRVAWALLKPRGTFILNIKNHIRADVEQLVAEWHWDFLKDIFIPEDLFPIDAQGMGMGENRDARTEHEYVMVLVKDPAQGRTSPA